MQNTWLIVIVALALARGLVYANLLHPWGLIDEEQHLDYVRVLAETGARPLANRDQLAPALAERIFDSQRWWILFRNPGPASADPAGWGLEGYSYQGYHPPLYYVVLTPFYLLAPGDPLLQLFFLRWVTVVLSAVSAGLVVGLLRDLWPDRPALVVLAALMYVLLPERTFAVSRLNNDVLLELASLAALWASLGIVRLGWRGDLAAWLGLSIGLGVLAKLSAVVLLVLPLGLIVPSWRIGRAWRGLLIVSVLVLLGVAPLVWSNLRHFGDPTGFAGFNQLAGFVPRPVTLEAVAQAVWSLWANAWVIWWWGAEVSTGPSVQIFYAVWAVFGLVALAGVIAKAVSESEVLRCSGGYFSHGDAVARRGTILAFLRVSASLCERVATGIWPIWLALLIVNAGAVLVSYFAGQVPVPQGRLLLPSLIVAVAALSAGWWHWVRHRPVWVWALPLLALIVIDAAYLRYLLYSFYQVPAERLTGSTTDLIGAFLSDKPDGWVWVAAASLLGYGAASAIVAWRVGRETRARGAP